MRLLLLSLLLLSLLSLASATLPFQTKTQNGLTVGIQPIGNTVYSDHMTSCFWANQSVSLSSAPALPKSGLEFLKSANISNIKTSLVRLREEKVNTTEDVLVECTEKNPADCFLLVDCLVAGKAADECTKSVTTTTSEFGYDSVASSTEVMYCFDTVLKKDKQGRTILPSSNPFNITLAGRKADPDPGCDAALSSANTIYTMTGDCVVAGKNAYNITAANVTLDCAGFSIIGNNTTLTRGVYIPIAAPKANATIKNCNILNFSTGIYIGGDTSDGTNITNNTVTMTYATSCSLTTGVCAGIFITAGDSATIDSNRVSTSTIANSAGILLASTATLTNITNNNITDSYYGISTASGANNLIVSGNNITNAAWISISAVTDASQFINNYVASNPSNAAILFTTTTDSVIANNTIINTSVGISLTSISTDNNISGNNITGATSYGLRLFGSSRNNYTSNYVQSTISSTEAPVYLTSTSNLNNFTNNTFNSSAAGSQGSIYLNSGKANRFINNTLINSGTGEAIEAVAPSGNNTFLGNNITSGKWVRDLNESNIYNDSTSGNIYYFLNGSGAWTTVNGSNLTVVNAPGWSTSGYMVNNTTFADYWVGYGNDSRAWTANEAGGAPAGPNITQITAIAVYPSSPTTANNLSCNITATSTVDATMNATFDWFKNGANQTSLNGTYIGLANNTNTAIANLTSGNLTAGDNWSCSVIVVSNTNSSVWNSSANVTVSAVGGAGITGRTNFVCAGGECMWTWANITTGDTIPSGNATDWVWHVWAAASGNYTINQSAYLGGEQLWNWVPE